MSITFDGQVVIVTGAGRRLGRAYALELGRRGAITRPGSSADRTAAQQPAGPRTTLTVWPLGQAKK